MKSDLDRLQGTWHIASLHMDGQHMPDALLGGASVLVRGDRFQSLGMGAEYEGRLTLDPVALPKAFDLKFTKGPEKGNTALGIYELAGDDDWKICFTTRPGATDRPKKFETKAGTGVALETLKRGKPEARPSKPKKSAAGPATSLEGEWKLVSGSLNGKAMDQMTVSFGKRVFRGHSTVLSFGPQVMQEATFTFDPSKSPCEIDYAHSKGMYAGKTQFGIYECDGKTLKLSSSTPGNPRPADFAPAKERNTTVFERA